MGAAPGSAIEPMTGNSPMRSAMARKAIILVVVSLRASGDAKKAMTMPRSPTRLRVEEVARRILPASSTACGIVPLARTCDIVALARKCGTFRWLGDVAIDLLVCRVKVSRIEFGCAGVYTET